MRKHALAAALLCAAASASADDIYKGVRGPTTVQSDTRVAYAENSAGVQSQTATEIVKLWTGKQHGWWGFA
ncbi:MAG TPA: hypothetical protein VJK52_00405, partial [Candidatus Nanoarchaeia archaeon]|nr:hypothetical protein [Candidatus Nanoarchaeia archaeon]